MVDRRKMVEPGADGASRAMFVLNILLETSLRDTFDART